jgi:lysophospholipase L1-like esterase
MPLISDRLTGWRAQAAAAVAVVLALVLGAESVARLVRLPSPLVLGPAPWNCTRGDARLGFTFMPSCSGNLSSTDFRTNAAGLRGPEVRDDRSIRILALGDSCTWGWHLDEADAYPSVLQRLLDRRVGAGHFQVLNAGAPGYTSLQGMRFLADRGRTLHPRIVIAGFLWNDAAPGRDAAEELAAPVPPAFLLRVHEFLLLHSHVYRWIQAWLPRGAAAPRESQRQQPHRVAPELFEENLRHIAALAHQIEAHPVFIDWNAAAAGEHRARIARVARELDVPVVTYDGPRFDLIHPTAAGDAALADRILVALTDAGLIEPAPAAVEAPRHTAPRRPSAAP